MSQCLLGDIGGTHARFALLADAKLGPIHSMRVDDYANPAAAIAHFLNCCVPDESRPDSAVIAAAGAVQGGRCALTNASWVLRTDELKRTFGLETVNIVNDLEALAWSIPRLQTSDCIQIGQGDEVLARPIAVIAPGTGLGIACLLRGGDGSRVLGSEGGHATLPAADIREAALVELLRKRHGHVSCERVLSGQGLVELYMALAQLQGSQGLPPLAEQITAAAIDGTSDLSRLTLETFCSLLGSVAGNTALMFNAQGGVYIGGGIVPKLVEYLGRTAFRARFESKGRFRRYLDRIPTRIIVRPDAAFLGLVALTEQPPMP
jgi:glucokinase